MSTTVIVSRPAKDGGFVVRGTVTCHECEQAIPFDVMMGHSLMSDAVNCPTCHVKLDFLIEDVRLQVTAGTSHVGVVPKPIRVQIVEVTSDLS